MSTPHIDEILTAIANPYRRELLLELHDENPQEIGTLSEIIENNETDKKELKMLFYHKHLPLLNDIGLIEWNKEAQSVYRGRHFDDLNPLLEIITEDLSERPGVSQIEVHG